MTTHNHLTTARPCVSPRLLTVLYESFKAPLCSLLHVSWTTKVATWRGLERWIGTQQTLLLPQEGRQAPHCSLFCSNLPCLLCCLSFQQKHQVISVRPMLEEMWMSIWDTVKDMGMRMWETWEWGCGRHGNEDVGDMGMRMWETWDWGCGRHGNEDVWDMGMRMWDTWDWGCMRHGNEIMGE